VLPVNQHSDYTIAMARILNIPVFVPLLLWFSSAAFASTNETLVADYMPYLNAKPWPRFPIVRYVATSSNIWIHPVTPKKFPTVTETHDRDADFTTVVIQFPDGQRYKTYNQFVLGPYLSAVYSGDFNADGKPDFVAVKPSSGNGLAGEYSTGVFAFSDDSDYRTTRITMMGFGPHNFVLDPKTKAFRFIHTSLRQGKTLDGNDHSFWVHRFYKWGGYRFEPDEALASVWIQYLERPNHEPTKLLDSRLKAQLWADAPASQAAINW
jgi:hypothetical protein